jgi:hypothetical protein
MAKRKQPTPFADDDFVYFELQSPDFCAFDLHNAGGSYTVPEFQPGVYRLAIDAIRPATSRDQKKRPAEIIAVDACQIFLVESAFLTKFQKCLDPKHGALPNYSYFEKLRKQVGIDFGHATVTADGNYVLDISKLERIVPDHGTKAPKTRRQVDLYEKVARRMRTFVCEQCFQEELMENGETPQELAQLAKDQGWLLAVPEKNRKSWFFEEFQVVGPKCAVKRG